jgi:phage shock protein C
MHEPRRLHRSRSDKMVAGVGAGLAQYFDIDPTLVRLGWVAAALLTGPVALLAYLACWIIVPQEPEPTTQDGVADRDRTSTH